MESRLIRALLPYRVANGRRFAQDLGILDADQIRDRSDEFGADDIHADRVIPDRSGVPVEKHARRQGLAAANRSRLNK